jgi:hypothetical protein
MFNLENFIWMLVGGVLTISLTIFIIAAFGLNRLIETAKDASGLDIHVHRRRVKKTRKQ